MLIPLQKDIVPLNGVMSRIAPQQLVTMRRIALQNLVTMRRIALQHLVTMRRIASHAADRPEQNSPFLEMFFYAPASE